MEFFELIEKRYSVRAYKSDPVEDSKLEKVLQAARLAPTAANRQPIRVIVIETAGRDEDLARIYGQRWFAEAPLVLCVCGIEAEAWMRSHDGKNYMDVDAAIVMDHIVLAATALGLGTCWVAAFDPEGAREALELPKGVEPIVFTPLGYADDTPRAKRRKAMSDIIKRGHW